MCSRRSHREPRPDVRYTTRDQWHVTLRFLGNADIDEASAALQRVDAPAVEVSMGPRVERLGRTVAMVPCAGLDGVAAAVWEATAGMDHPLEARPFLGHLTIARMKNARRCPATGFDVATTSRRRRCISCAAVSPATAPATRSSRRVRSRCSERAASRFSSGPAVHIGLGRAVRRGSCRAGTGRIGRSSAGRCPARPEAGSRRDARTPCRVDGRTRRQRGLS